MIRWIFKGRQLDINYQQRDAYRKNCIREISKSLHLENLALFIMFWFLHTALTIIEDDE
jgi:hypothetical protein